MEMCLNATTGEVNEHARIEHLADSHNKARDRFTSMPEKALTLTARKAPMPI